MFIRLNLSNQEGYTTFILLPFSQVISIEPININDSHPEGDYFMVQVSSDFIKEYKVDLIRSNYITEEEVNFNNTKLRASTETDISFYNQIKEITKTYL